jgi:hypothetical protein
MNDIEFQDPNAPSTTQLSLKRIEVAIRKHASCELLLKLDGICHMTDMGAIRSELTDLTKRLEKK